MTYIIFLEFMLKVNTGSPGKLINTFSRRNVFHDRFVCAKIAVIVGIPTITAIKFFTRTDKYTLIKEGTLTG